MVFTIETDWKAVERSLTVLERKQIPFAAAQTATSLARRAQKAEVGAEISTFDKPTAFTKSAFGVIPARKDTATATLFAKDIQAAYLKPFLDGGLQVLGNKRAILRPANLRLDQYGNIPRGKIAALKGKPNTFVGAVHTRSGQVISGVWQRPGPGKGNTGMKLLVRFTDPVNVKERLPYFATAQQVVEKFGQADAELWLAKAIATMR